MTATLVSKPLNAKRVAGSVSRDALSLPYDIPLWDVDLASGGTLDIALTVDNGPDGRNYPPHRAVVTGTVTGNFAGMDLTTPEWDAQFHRLEWTHHHGDNYAGDFAYPERLLIKSRNISHGQRAVHMYREPGDFVHRVYVYDQDGAWGVKDIKITVAKPPVYDPARVIVMAADGNFANAPFCLASNRVTTWAALNARAVAVTGEAPKVIYLKRGENYVAGTQIVVDNFDIFPWGKDADPIPRITTTNGVQWAFRTSSSYIKVQDIEVHGSWDPVAEKQFTGMVWDDLSAIQSGGLVSAGGNTHSTLDRCVGYYGTMTLLSSEGSSGSVVLHECLYKDFKDFMSFGTQTYGGMYYLGCKVEQDPDAASGGLAREFFNTDASGEFGQYPGNAHNGIRNLDTAFTIVWGCDFFGRHGWTTQDWDVYANNPMIRLNTRPLPGSRSIISNNWFETLIVGGSNRSPGSPDLNALWEFNTLVRDPTTGACISVLGMGHTCRNNIMIVPNPAKTATGSGEGLVDLLYFVKFGEAAADPTKGRNEVYNNTMLDLAASGKHGPSFAPVTLVGSNVYEGNNIYYAPNLDTPQIADGPLDLTLLPWAPRYKGHRKSYEFKYQVYKLTADVPHNGTFLVPYWNARDRRDANNVLIPGPLLTAADFAGTWGRHRLTLSTGKPEFKEGPQVNSLVTAGAGANRLSTVVGTIDITFEAGGIRVTNKSNETWPSGLDVSLWLHRGTTAMPMDVSTATPADSLKRGWITTGSGAYQQATTGLVSLHAIVNGTVAPRRGSKHPQAVAGTPSKGATEPA